MADFQVTGKSAIDSVDRAADLLLIYDFSASQLKNTTVNTLLDLTSHPVSVDDSQTLTNKTLDTTNTVTLLDSLFTLKDNSDPTKIAVFQLSGITTGTTRTYTLPNGSSTLVDLSTTQTLTNKTLTSPTINTATISNPTLTVDTVAEFTGANGVTVDGVKLKDGALATNNSVVTANVTDTAITPAKLQSGTGSSWSWQSWTPTWTNLTVGNGTVVAKYIQIGKTVVFRLSIAFGSTSSISGGVIFTLPVTAVSYGGSATMQPIGTVRIFDSGTGVFEGAIYFNSTTTAVTSVFNSASTYVSGASLSSTVPMTWTTSDELNVSAIYEAA